MIILKTISRAFFRTIQIAVLVFFGIWLYEKLAVGGLSFAMLSLIGLPFLIVGLVVGAIISGIFFLKGSIFKPIRIINLILLLAYIAAMVYMAILIF